MNPGGRMGIGAIVRQKGTILLEYSDTMSEHPNNTNNVAEYLALIKILDFLIRNNFTENRISIKGDSMLVVNQMKGLWRMKQGAYLSFAKEAKVKFEKFKNISINWIPREENESADRLSKMSSY
jgi:ribonuclease HI